MPTKLSKYSEAVMEAAWLAAVIVVPLFFNVYSSRIFEPDKITLLRTLGLVILGAWIVKLVDEGQVRWEHLQPGESRLKSALRIPLVLPVAAMALVYLLSTVFSVVPKTSFWGSYQRLQGTYTTFSYLIVFAAIAGNLRRRAQVDRLLSAVIVTSLPISLYGILQHYQLDPIPWGGDVVTRIAANMGNSIFVAAYLIMAFPPTLVRIVESFGDILQDRGRLLANFARATAYVFILALQLIALFFSGSRGPWLGWMASVFFLFVVLSLVWRKRWMTIGIIGVSLVAGAALAVLNIPNGPLESIRNRPEINRLGHLLDAETYTGRVRVLIWQGASQLVQPHQPLEYPDGHTDPFNFLRPLIGYGPESMYVAYNPFYPPELAQVEKRNASPDRSHNETWDSLVITGVLGLLVYLTLFGSVFYFGLKWLGLLKGPQQRNLFLGLYVGLGILSGVFFVVWKGLAYLGVGLPFGMLVGVILYLILTALFGSYESPTTEGETLRALTLVGILAVFVAHFMEINFGIAIAATRSYFWVFAGLMLVIGYVMPKYGAYETVPGAEIPASNEKANRAPAKALSRKKRRTEKRSGRGPAAWPDWLQQGLVGGMVLAILLVILGYNYLSIALGGKSTMEVFWTSLTLLTAGSATASYGILMLCLTTWLVAGIVFASEGARFQEDSVWVKTLAVILGSSLLAGLIYWLWQAASLASLANFTAANVSEILNQIGGYEGLLTKFYIYLFLLVLAGGVILVGEWPAKISGSTWRGAVAAPLALIIAVSLASYTNLRVIQADIAFKLADPFTRGTSWPVAISIYDQAISLAPSEDYYYLFLGRAYLEQAKTLTDTTERDNLITQAASDLKKAQRINPLNTDHTANLARLYSLWASFLTDPQEREQKGQISAEYFAKAVTLSPHNARLWDEYAVLYLNLLPNPQESFKLLTHAEELDPTYDWTQALLGQYYANLSQTASDPAAKTQDIEQAVIRYRRAITSTRDTSTQLNYTLAMGQMYINAQQPQDAIRAIQAAIALAPNSSDRWKYEQTLAQLYAQTGDKTNALVHANQALSAAPDNQKTSVQSLLNQIQTMP